MEKQGLKSIAKTILGILDADEVRALVMELTKLYEIGDRVIYTVTGGTPPKHAKTGTVVAYKQPVYIPFDICYPEPDYMIRWDDGTTTRISSKYIAKENKK